eukprot:12906206-Prorocentrum_lima.AAC.1
MRGWGADRPLRTGSAGRARERTYRLRYPRALSGHHGRWRWSSWLHPDIFSTLRPWPTARDVGNSSE